MANVPLVLEVEARRGKQNVSAFAGGAVAPAGQALAIELAEPDPLRLESGERAGDAALQQECLPYLLRLRQTANVKRALERALSDRDCTYAGHSWQSKEAELPLIRWSPSRRVILLRRRLRGTVELTDLPGKDSQLQLGLVEVGSDRQLCEYGALVTSLDAEIITLCQLYRDRGDCENAFDEL